MAITPTRPNPGHLSSSLRRSFCFFSVFAIGILLLGEIYNLHLKIQKCHFYIGLYRCHSEHLGHISETTSDVFGLFTMQEFFTFTTLLEIERVVILKWMCLTVVCVLRYKKLREKI